MCSAQTKEARVVARAVAAAMVAVLVLPVLPQGRAAGADEAAVQDAVERGVAWVVSQQAADGSWGAADADKGVSTAYALVKLQNHAYALGYASPFDAAYPYVASVEMGWGYLFDLAVAVPLAPQDHTGGATGTVDDPDTDGDGVGVSVPSAWGSSAVPTTAAVLCALEATGTPDQPNEAGLDFDGDGAVDTYGQIAQDAADWLAMAQGDAGNDEGGWEFDALDNQTGSAFADNDNGGVAAVGLAAAEAAGAVIPEWVGAELDVWVGVIQDPVDGDADDGGSYWNPDWTMWLPLVDQRKTGYLLVQLALCDEPLDGPRMVAAMDYVVRHWQDEDADVGWGYGARPVNYEAMFALRSGLMMVSVELLDLDGDGVGERDWLAEFADVLVAEQNADGSWPATGERDPVCETVWALLAMEQPWTPPPPVTTLEAVVDIRPGSSRNPLNPRGRGILPVVLVGTADVDVTAIDRATIRLGREGVEATVAPCRVIEWDVTSPESAGSDGRPERDGVEDLVLLFRTGQLVKGLGLAEEGGNVVELTLTAGLDEDHGGIPVAGKDSVDVLQVRRPRQVLKGLHSRLRRVRIRGKPR